MVFRRQYLQLFEPDFLLWPSRQLLRDVAIQAWLYTNLFDAQKNTVLPPERYQVRVLKLLVAKIEQAVTDAQKDDVGRKGVELFFLSLAIFAFPSPTSSPSTMF